MKKGDIVIVVLGILLAFAIYLGYTTQQQQTNQLQLVIKSEGQIIKTMPCRVGFSESYQVENQYGSNQIVNQDGVVSMALADCRNQICVHSKPISAAGQSIICLPHRVSVELLGSGEPEIDQISY